MAIPRHAARHNDLTSKYIQEYILQHTGIKTSVKKGTGSNKGYVIFSPMLQNGKYSEFPFEFRRAFIKTFEMPEPKPTFASSTQILIYGIDNSEKEEFKKERKPKSIEDMKVRQWGSKNSQMRYNKAISRHAKALRRGENRVRFY